MTRVDAIKQRMVEVCSLGKRFLKSLLKPEHMQEKRTYMFETEDGERYNPFSDMEEGVEAEEEKEWKYSPYDFE